MQRTALQRASSALCRTFVRASTPPSTTRATALLSNACEVGAPGSRLFHAQPAGPLDPFWTYARGLSRWSGSIAATTVRRCGSPQAEMTRMSFCRGFSSSQPPEEGKEEEDPTEDLSEEDIAEITKDTDELLDTFMSKEKLDSEQGSGRELVALVRNLDGETVGSTKLRGDVFDVPIRSDIVHSVVVWQLAKRRSGTAKKKTRGEVNRTGKKPFNQKGTGRARAGDWKSPHHVGGGRAHPPRPRSFEFKLNKKVRRLGLKCALSARLAEGSLLIVDDYKVDEPKTNYMVQKLESLFGEDYPTVLFVDSAPDHEQFTMLKRATKNLYKVDCLPSVGLNVYSILKRRKLVVTLGALERIQERLTAPIKR
eukprot:CAMPEP_0118925628 /NCGR_PEP_ID=MMETSP1169-20130426/3483_1 /TAXON_ID=36882 /ORGANISM="Pyramimonas obovata, Strain CCMP722" /LENGTH=366 /DNA_ID=CAMNT_0006866977 /DNA_START=40 /DNA_END=1140 /DNA_ORIENTATION=-